MLVGLSLRRQSLGHEGQHWKGPPSALHLPCSSPPGILEPFHTKLCQYKLQRMPWAQLWHRAVPGAGTSRAAASQPLCCSAWGCAGRGPACRQRALKLKILQQQPFLHRELQDRTLIRVMSCFLACSGLTGAGRAVGKHTGHIQEAGEGSVPPLLPRNGSFPDVPPEGHPAPAH